jgi:hypothetical protein
MRSFVASIWQVVVVIVAARLAHYRVCGSVV